VAQDIDVVVVTWQGRALVGSCLAHLARQTAAHHVVVVDNGSTDGTAEAVRTAHPEVTLLELTENVGFGRGNNRGAALGSAPYLVLVNNDVDVAPDFLERIVAPLRADERVGAVAGLTTRPGSGLVDQLGIQLDAGLCAYNRGAGQHPDTPVASVMAAPCGAVVAYRRTAYEALGGFDEQLFAYSEDLDLGLRLLAAGWTHAEARDARGVHVGSATTGWGSPWQRRLTSFGRGFVLGRYRPVRVTGLLHAAVIDAAVITYGLLRHRTTVPAVERWRGVRAGRSGGRRPVPATAVDDRIGLLLALRRLGGGRRGR